MNGGGSKKDKKGKKEQKLFFVLFSLLALFVSPSLLLQPAPVGAKHRRNKQ
jgi:hypothetical protein